MCVCLRISAYRWYLATAALITSLNRLHIWYELWSSLIRFLVCLCVCVWCAAQALNNDFINLFKIIHVYDWDIFFHSIGGVHFVDWSIQFHCNSKTQYESNCAFEHCAFRSKTKITTVLYGISRTRYGHNLLCNRMECHTLESKEMKRLKANRVNRENLIWFR